MDEWIEIFRGGKQTDSQGREHDGTEMVNKSVSLFNAQDHEPPICIGHPKDNNPAFGWVKDLKSEGGVLLAKLDQVQPEFKDMVERGLFKKRSASFYPDGRLRHVAYLGAAAPAVKGLKDIAFEEGEESITFEFSDSLQSYKWSNVSRVFRSLRDFLIEKFDKETADSVVNDFEIEELKQEPEREIEEVPAFNEPKEKIMPEPTAKTFSEEDMERIKKEAAEKAKKEAAAEFSESKADEKARIERLEKREKEITFNEISTRIDGLLKDGIVTPAMKKQGLAQFMESLPDESPIEFGEGDGKKTKTPREFMFGLLESLPKQVNFSETTGGDTEDPTNDQDQLIANFMEKNPKASEEDAIMALSEKHPDVFVV